MFFSTVLCKSDQTRQLQKLSPFGSGLSQRFWNFRTGKLGALLTSTKSQRKEILNGVDELDANTLLLHSDPHMTSLVVV